MKPAPEDNPSPLPPARKGAPDQATVPGAPSAPGAADSEGRFYADESRQVPPADDRARLASTIDQRLLSTDPDLAGPNALPLAPCHFGDYELLAKIGRGGMGEVYKARHLLLNVEDAVKVIVRDRLAAPALRRRFLDEMQTLIRLDHPNIVKVRTAGEVQGELYFSMHFEQGGDLDRLIREKGAQEARRAADLVRQVAEAVEHAHQQGVIHCDLKPHNVLLSLDGTPKVTDFGLALLLARGEDGRPARGEPVGTPSYMPPEQAEGRPEKIGPGSDVYGLGAILYELLTGQPPFQGPLPETLRQVREDAPRRPRALRPDVPRRLETICLRCLEKDPGRRYPTAGHLARALQGLLRPWWKRRWREAVTAAACLLLAGGVLWSGWQGYHLPRAEARDWVTKGEEARDHGNPRQAMDHFTVAEARYADLLAGRIPPPDRAELRLALARVKTQLGELREDARQPEAVEPLRAAEDLLNGLRQGDPRNPEYTLLLAEVRHNLGIYFSDRNNFREAKKHFEEGLRLREELRPSQSASRDYRRDLARSYGYLGDVQLVLGESEAARRSYDEARELRTELAEKGDDVEALCLHARDFGNMAGYCDWLDQTAEAVQCYRQRLDYYQAHATQLGKGLPGRYQTERADTALALAELELDRPGGPAEEVRELLRQAQAEYTRLLDGESEGEALAPLKAGLAHIHVTWGKYHHLQERPEEARAELRAAHNLFKSLEDGQKVLADDYYSWAVTSALWGELATPGPDRLFAQSLAIDRLRRAIRNGFLHLKRLQRERGFAALKGEGGLPDQFTKTVAEVVQRGQAP